jgi:3-oxoacid CoA-transferase subunit B
MDLVAGVKRCVVIMDHTDKAGRPKLLKHCTLPLTGIHCVQRIVTNFGIFDVAEGGLRISELAPGMIRDEIAAKTEAALVN